MSKACMGCGVNLQSNVKNQIGYVSPQKIEEAKYCERCYRLKHYHEIVLDTFDRSNEEILQEANEYQAPVYYFVDFINLNEESICFFQKITGPKFLVLTKIDLIPYTISLSRVIERIRSIYHISEEILCLSVKRPSCVSMIWNHMQHHAFSKVLFLGMTNVGKSSFLNALSQKINGCEVEALISEMPNTTRDFLSWNIGDVQVIDAPGFSYEAKVDESYLLKAVPKKYFRPITLPMKQETFVVLEDFLILSQNLERNSVTFYGSNALGLKRLYQKIEGDFQRISLTIPENSDLVLHGIGFFAFKKSAEVILQIKGRIAYSVRDSLIGGVK